MCHLLRKGAWSVLCLFTEQPEQNLFWNPNMFKMFLFWFFFNLWVHVETAFYHHISLKTHFTLFSFLLTILVRKIYWAWVSSSLLQHSDRKSFKGGPCKFHLSFRTTHIHRTKLVECCCLAKRLARYSVLFINGGASSGIHKEAQNTLPNLHEFRTVILMYSLCTDYKELPPGLLRILTCRLVSCTSAAQYRCWSQ